MFPRYQRGIPVSPLITLLPTFVPRFLDLNEAKTQNPYQLLLYASTAYFFPIEYRKPCTSQAKKYAVLCIAKVDRGVKVDYRIARPQQGLFKIRKVEVVAPTVYCTSIYLLFI